MSARIFRYEVPVDDAVHTFELHGNPLAVGLRRPTVVEFWAIHDDDMPVDGLKRRFTAVGTGQPLPEGFRPQDYWGHAYDMGGALVWHLIEVSA